MSGILMECSCCGGLGFMTVHANTIWPCGGCLDFCDKGECKQPHVCDNDDDGDWCNKCSGLGI